MTSALSDPVTVVMIHEDGADGLSLAPLVFTSLDVAGEWNQVEGDAEHTWRVLILVRPGKVPAGGNLPCGVQRGPSTGRQRHLTRASPSRTSSYFEQWINCMEIRPVLTANVTGRRSTRQSHGRFATATGRLVISPIYRLSGLEPRMLYPIASSGA